MGFTQEQVASYLGVSAPAVHKWEKGSSYPDITLLPSLARLLGTDLNTMLSFQEELSKQEIGNFLNELYSIATTKGMESAFDMAMEKIREYPSCDILLLNTALALEGMVSMYVETEEQEEKARKVQEEQAKKAAEQKAQRGEEEKGFSNASMHAMISAGQSMEEADAIHHVRTSMEGQAHVAKGEIAVSKSRGEDVAEMESNLSQLEGKIAQLTGKIVKKYAEDSEKMKNASDLENVQQDKKIDDKEEEKEEENNEEEKGRKEIDLRL